MDENIQKEIERYLQKEMNSNERTLFEQKIEADAELKEEVFLQQSIHNVFANEATMTANNKEVEALTSLLRSEKYENIFTNIKANTTNYLERQQKPSRKKYKYRNLLAIATIFIAFMTIIPIFKENNTQPLLYAKYANDFNTIPSFIEKGDTKKKLEAVEKNYKLKDYNTVIGLIHSLADSTKTEYPNLSLYLGASYFHQNNYDKAIEIFNTFSQSDAYDSSKGYWYMVLIYLKQEKLDEAKKIVLIITKNPNNYKYNEASELLKELD